MYLCFGFSIKRYRTVPGRYTRKSPLFERHETPSRQVIPPEGKCLRSFRRGRRCTVQKFLTSVGLTDGNRKDREIGKNSVPLDLYKVKQVGQNLISKNIKLFCKVIPDKLYQWYHSNVPLIHITYNIFY